MAGITDTSLLKCDICDYTTCKRNHLDRHFKTKKHQVALSGVNEAGNSIHAHTCTLCLKTYGTRVGLWKHNKTCSATEEEPHVVQLLTQQDKPCDSDLIQCLMRETSECKTMLYSLQQSMMDMFKERHVVENTINNNSHNKTFNLNVFLNEDCKDAMNLNDFVDSFQLQLSDLESVGELGYVQGISNIIIKKLNEMDVYKRPIHCSDAKREILHIKENNKWERDTVHGMRLRRAIKRISKKNSDLLLDWKDAHPNSQFSYSSFNDQYLNLIIQSCGGTEDPENSETKIIKNIAKHVILCKK